MVVWPFLLECDERGQVIWMSDRSRSWFGTATTLVEAISGEPLRDGIKPGLAALRFRKLLDLGGAVLISVQPEETSSAGLEAAELAGLQGRLLRHYFRLQRAERRLARRAARRRGSGRRAIRQIELERQRLGRELHTGVGQLLAAIQLQLQVIAVQFPDAHASVEQHLNRISLLAADALDQVRSISQRLHPPEWKRLALVTAIEQLWEVSGMPDRFAATLHTEPLPREPDLEVKVLLYRAAQEAISNLRHSHAARVDAVLAPRGDRVVLSVRDNGVGFDPARLSSAPASVAAGIGLRSIREQAAALGGELKIQSGPEGTTLEVSVPIHPLEP